MRKSPERSIGLRAGTKYGYSVFRKGEKEMCKVKEIAKNCFKGELTLPKAMLWLIGAVCLLGGIVYGLKTAPMTHGVMIGSNNGNNNGNNSGNGHKEEEEETPAVDAGQN